MEILNPQRRTTQGQASVEYMLLLCTVLVLCLLTGTFLSKYGTELIDSLALKILEAAFILAMP